MDVTPLSMQMVVPRVSDAAQVQHNLNQASAMQQDFEALREKADARSRTTRTAGRGAAAMRARGNAARQRTRRRRKSRSLSIPRADTISTSRSDALPR